MRDLVHSILHGALALVLAVGTQAGFCDVLSLAGVNPHPLAVSVSGCQDLSVCEVPLDDHGHEGHGENHPGPDRGPCGEDCGTVLTELSAQGRTVELPLPLVADLAGISVPLPGVAAGLRASSPAFSSEPPDWLACCASPPITGRFLL